LGENDEAFTGFITAIEEKDADRTREILQGLPLDEPVEWVDCPIWELVSIPVRVPRFETVCRWVCGELAGQVWEDDKPIEVEAGRSISSTPELKELLLALGVVACRLEGSFDREWLDLWRQVCNPDYWKD
jgi:hypothetical protein